MTKVVSVRRRPQHAGHGGDVEAEEPTANSGEATDGVDVVEGLHLGVSFGQAWVEEDVTGVNGEPGVAHALYHPARA